MRRTVLLLIAVGAVGLSGCTDADPDPDPAAGSPATASPIASPAFVEPSPAGTCTAEWALNDSGVLLTLTTDGAAQVVITTKTASGTAGPGRTLSVLLATSALPVELPTEAEVREVTVTGNGKPCRVTRP